MTDDSTRRLHRVPLGARSFLAAAGTTLLSAAVAAGCGGASASPDAPGAAPSDDCVSSDPAPQDDVMPSDDEGPQDYVMPSDDTY